VIDTELEWVRASRCYGHGDCVELAIDGHVVLIRDSKNPDGAHLRFTRAEFAAFIDGARRGEFDRLLN